MTALPKKLAILAGSGSLPENVAIACMKREIPFFVVNLGGAAGDWIAQHNALEISLGQVGVLFDALHKEGCDAVTMAGALARPQISKLRLDWQGTKLLARVSRLLRQGDDALLRGIAGIIEENGFRVIGPELVLDDALAPSGVLTKVVPGSQASDDIEKGRAILTALGPHDVGQAVVVADGVCLAVEAFGGTSRMLHHVASFHAPQTKAGVLVKLPKPGQDRRIDLPSIGPETVPSVRAAGLSGIAIAAGNGFIIDQANTIARCNEAGLFLVGVNAEAS